MSGRRLVVAIIVATLSASLFVMLAFNMVLGPVRLPQQGVRFLLSVGLCVYLYRGANWARLVMVALYAPSGLVVLWSAITLGAGASVTSAWIASGLVSVASAITLLFVPKVRAYFSAGSPDAGYYVALALWVGLATAFMVPAGTQQDDSAAYARVLEELVEWAAERDALLAEEYDVAGLNPMWRENDYYVGPSAYADVRSYFVDFRNYAVALREVSSVENRRVKMTEILEREGLESTPELMQNDLAWDAALDTLYTVMEAFATSAIEFHDELLRFEGGFYVDPASAELAYSDLAPSDRMIELEDDVALLGEEFLERQERALLVREMLTDSLREAVPR